MNATYVYCVVSLPARPSATRAPAGVPGATRPRPLPLAGQLWFVAADAPIAMYGEDAVNAGLRDLDWVAAMAVAHEGVVEHFTRQRGATVIPMKLLTLFASPASAREELLRQRQHIQTAVRRIAGCEEWGVRVFARQAAASTSAGHPAGAAGMSGAAFLASRKAAREAGRQMRVRSLEAAEEAYARLAKFCRAAKQRARNADEAATPPLLDAAFLVAGPSRARFKAAARAEAARLAAAGAQMTLTGPWPAYNFIVHDGETR